MAEVQIGIGMVGITGHLLVNVRTAANPTVIAAFQDFPGPQPSNRNIVFTGLSPEPSFFDYRETAGGSDLGVLLVIYEVDVTNNRIIAEKRFYRAGRGGENDPAVGSSQIIDPYLNGKTIGGVFKEGFRFLEPSDTDVKEYSLVAGGGIQLENFGDALLPVFGDGEVYSIDINYSQAVPTIIASSTPYLKFTEITANTTLSNTEKNGRVKCNGASTRLVVTLPILTTLTDGDYYYLTQHNGSQYQTKIVTQPGDSILFTGNAVSQICIGKGEGIWIEKRGLNYEVVNEVPGMLHVGERFAGSSLLHPNTLPENGQLIDGDDYPRLYFWIINQPVNNYVAITEAAITNVSFVHDSGKEGMFYVSTTSKKMRLPNTQGWSEKGLKTFVGLGSDTTRPFDYPGGSQPAQVGQIDFKIKKGDSYGGNSVSPMRNAPGGNVQADDNYSINVGKVNTVANVGVIYLRRI